MKKMIFAVLLTITSLGSVATAANDPCTGNPNCVPGIEGVIFN